MEILVFASIAPFILWPIELIFPYPHFVEELAKSALIFIFLKSLQDKRALLQVALAGALFAFSESVLYLFNIAAVGSLKTFFIRLAATTPMHIITFVIILSAVQINKRLIILGLVLAILIHYFYNLVIQVA